MRLVLIRHGESVWNHSGRYTGWSDVGLTANGVLESYHAGILLAKQKIIPDYCITSTLRRSKETTSHILSAIEETTEKKDTIPIVSHWRLNERDYGSLTGKDRSKHPWEGGYFDTPPDGESYHQTAKRVIPLITTHIHPLFNILLQQKEEPCILVCGHKNSLRALICHFEGHTYPYNDIFGNITIANAIPRLYKFF